MSGGKWNYMSARIEQTGKELRDIFKFLAVVETELDWGASGDTCLNCAKKRLGEAMMCFFDAMQLGAEMNIAIAVMRDNKQNLCDKCEEFRLKRKREKGCLL